MRLPQSMGQLTLPPVDNLAQITLLNFTLKDKTKVKVIW